MAMPGWRTHNAECAALREKTLIVGLRCAGMPVE
jgi:hypothetical protein